MRPVVIRAFLLLAVVLVWGGILWRSFGSRIPEAEVGMPAPVLPDTLLFKDRSHDPPLQIALLRDPFLDATLKKVVRRTKAGPSQRHKQVGRKKALKVPEASSRPWPSIEYKGSMKGGEGRVAFLSVDGRDVMAREGDEAAPGIVVVHVKDSTVLVSSGDARLMIPRL